MPRSETGFAAHHVVLPNRPIAPSTYTAHVVMLYTKASGKYVAMAQHVRSHLRAQVFVRLRKGDGGGDAEGERLRGMSTFGVMYKEKVSILSSRVADITTK